MKRFVKFAFGAAMLAGAAAALAIPAQARVSVGIGIGVPGPAYGPPPPPPPAYNAYCDRYSRWYDPYRCAPAYAPPPAYDGYYYDPIFFGGSWYNGPLPYRYVRGAPEFFIGGAWHGNLHFDRGGFHAGGGRPGFDRGHR